MNSGGCTGAAEEAAEDMVVVDVVEAEAAVWAEVVVKAEVEWVARLPQGRAVFVYAPAVVTKRGME